MTELSIAEADEFCVVCFCRLFNKFWLSADVDADFESDFLFFTTLQKQKGNNHKKIIKIIIIISKIIIKIISF